MSRVKVEITEKAFYDLKKVDILKGQVCSIGHTYNMETDERKDFHIDVEIAAMEKQPEYEYVPIDIKAVNEDMLDTVFIDGNGEVSIRDASVAEFLCCELYRRVEITPEVKRERKVEELAMVMREKDIPGSSIGWCSVADSVKVTYRSMAKTAIEWMESKK